MTGKIIDRRVVPDRYEIFENDSNIKTITFSVSKVNDGVDLTDLYAFINLESENFITNKVLLSKTVTDDQITLIFNIDGAISNNDGITKAQISFESSDLSIIYSTAIFYIDVKSSVDSYSNTTISAQSLHDLQSDLTKTLDSVNKKISLALEDAKNNLKFAELNIDGIVYDGSKKREIKHSAGVINQLPKAIVSEYEGETNDLLVYGTYNYKNKDVPGAKPNGIEGSILKGLGTKIEDEDSPYYEKFLIRIQNCNGNYFEPLNENEIRNGSSKVKAIIDEGVIYVNSLEYRSIVFEVPLKQIFRKNTYYNLKLQYVTGTVNIVEEGTPLAISLFNKKTLEEKKIDINQFCGENIPICNTQGKNFFSGEQGEICLKVYVNSGGGENTTIEGVKFKVVIEESENPCIGFPLREVDNIDIYLDEPLFCMKQYDEETGELVDEIYDELDLKNSRIIRRVRKGIVESDYINQPDTLEKPFDMWIYAQDLYSFEGAEYDCYDAAYRPTMKISTPFVEDLHNHVKFDITGNMCWLSSEYFGDCNDMPPEICFFAFVYPLKYPKIETIDNYKIPYRKGLNCFDIISEYPVEHVILKL